MKNIPLTQGQVAIVDDEDFGVLSAYKWHAHWMPRSKTFYARREEAGVIISMHRIVCGVGPGQEVDHRDHNGLHNWRNNLRPCTTQQNIWNQRKKKSRSAWKGVKPCGSKWRAQITVSGKRIHLGYYVEEKDAAIAYDKAARRYFGEFAYLNFGGKEELAVLR